MKYNYQAFGMVFASEIKIFEFHELKDRLAREFNLLDDSVVEIRERAFENIENPAHDLGWVRANSDRCVFHLEGKCQIEVRTNAITTLRLSAISDRELSYYVVSCALPAIAHMRKMLPMHISMVEFDNHVWMFLGDSGAGKSTAAAALATTGRGHLLCDDLAILVDKDGINDFHFGIRSIKLWRDSVDALDIGEMHMDADPIRDNKFHISWDGPEFVSFQKVKGLVYLNWAASNRCTRLKPIENYVALVRSIQGPRLMKIFNDYSSVYEKLSLLASQVSGLCFIRSKQRSQNSDSIQNELEKIIELS